MAQSDWRRIAHDTIELHVSSLRAPSTAAEAAGRVKAGGELHGLVAWIRRRLPVLAAGTTTALEAPVASDAPWIGLVKITLRRGAAGAANVARFARELENETKTFERLSKELLGGAAPPALPPDPGPSPVARPIPAASPAPAKPAAAASSAPAPASSKAPPSPPAPAKPEAVAKPTPAAPPAPPASTPAPSSAPAADKKGKKRR